MNILTTFNDFVKQQLGAQQKVFLSSQTDKVTELQKSINRQENAGIGRQIAKGVLILGGTVCSALATFTLFGKRVEELKADAGVMGERLGRQLLSIPEVKETLYPVSIFPTNGMPVTVISVLDLFFDSDGQGLVLDVVEKDKQTIPSWMVLEVSPDPLGAYYTLGQAWNVHVVGNLAYVVESFTGLQIIDVSNPSFPILKGTYDTPDNAASIQVVQNLAYIADGTSGLQIIDVSNPSSPVFKGVYDTPGTAYGVYIAQNVAYIADYGSGLQIIDVSNSSAPFLKGTYDTSGNAVSVQVVGNLAYIADGASGLTIIDVSNSSAPFLKGVYDTPGSAFGVHVVGNFAYVADYGSGLQIIDVSNSTFPTFKGAYDTPGTAWGVYVVENLAYVVDNANGLNIIDVSHPNAPILKGTYNLLNSFFYGVYVIGHLVYVADNRNYLHIIENRFTLSGTPNQTQVGNYDIELIAKDPDQNEVSQIFRVRVEGSPVATGTIPNQLINVGAPFTYFIDQTVFGDPNLDVIFYSSKLESQNPLPSWLSFSSIGIFSGNPTSSDVGVYTIKVLAFDRIAPEQAETTFSLVVDHFPTVTTTISDHAADIGMPYNFSVPSGLFYDADVSDVLTYNATLSNGNPLPSWLSFNGLVLSGSPSAANAGSLSITLSAKDQALAKAQTSFTLTVEHFPDLVNPLPNQLAGAGQPFTFVVPSNTYTDLDGDIISYKAMRSDGSILPFWLGFNSLAQEFQGTPLVADKGVFGLKVIAEDSKGGQTAALFDLNVVDALGEEVVVIGRDFIYVIPNNMIDNPQGPITYTLTLGSGSPLPSWLIFDPVNAVISGTPPSTSEKEYPLLISASDGVQTPVNAIFKLRVDVNAPPQVANSISNQVAQVNQEYRFAIPDDTFTDSNGDLLTLSALRANGQELPNWLKFDGIARTLEGKPGRGDTGAFSDSVLPLQICATDGNEKICSVFDLSVQGTSNQELAVSIGVPLGSALAAGLAGYNKRGVFINPFNKNKYDRGTQIVPIGKSFTYPFKVDANKVILVQAFKGKKTLAEIPLPKGLDEKGWCEWLKTDKEICGGRLLPSWLRYDERNNQLSSVSNPRQEDVGLYVVRVYGDGDMILEEVKLDVGGEGENIEMGKMN